MVDGEIIVVVGDRLEFEVLQQRIHPAASRVKLLSEQTPASFVAFDLLALGDVDFMPQPFADRRAALADALADAQPPIHLTPITLDHDLAEQWFSQFEGAGLDGVVAKPLDGGLPAGQAGDVQDQAPAHRGLRRRRLPGAQERPGLDRVVAARVCTTTRASSPRSG